jgi:hypothetical protein
LRSALLKTLAGVAFLAAACGRIGYEPLPGPASSGAGGSLGAGTGGVTTTGAGGARGGGSGGSGAAGATGAAGASGAGGGLDASGPTATCSQAGSPTMTWSFDADMQSWELSGPGTMVWTAAAGDPSAGALQLDWNSGSTTQPRLVQALGDLSGRIATARVWLDSGTGVWVKLFVQTTSKLSWGDGGTVDLSPGQWTCLALDMSNPSFSKPQYDPTDVQVIGFQLQAGGQSRVYIDTVAY